MEQECISGLYQSLGISVGGVISSADVCNLFQKVFHLPSTVGDMDVVIKKISGSEDGWACKGEKVLDVLLEMERERGRKEELYWDRQLLNAGLLNALYKMDASDRALSSRHDPTKTGPCEQGESVAESESVSLPVHMDPPQKGQVVEQRERRERRRLQRGARQSMARLMLEGVGAAALPSGGVPGLEVKGQPCGCVSLSDLVTLVDVKYDAVAHTLYTEMLEEHHGGAIWGSLLPWQRAEREAEMEELAEQALESGDLLCLSELPGAFRIYSYPEGVSLRGCPDWQTDGTQSWSSVSLLSEIHTSCQRERETLTNLAKRLDGGDPRLLGAYLRLATLRAQREKLSRGALLAAMQPWESWPCVRSPATMEQGKLWLQEEEEEREEGLALSHSPQQAVLQCLVLSQEKERRFVCRVLHGVSLEDLQGLAGQQTSKEDAPPEKNASLREACVRRLRHVHSTLLTQTQHWGTFASAPPPRLLGQESIQTKDQSQSPQAGPHSQLTWGACALVLLTQLMELHDAQIAEILPLLPYLSEQRLLELKEEYEGDLQEQRHSSLLKLLSSDVPSCLDAPPESITPQSSTGIAPITTSGRDPEQVNVDINRERQKICADCGASQEDLPYLEILSMSDQTRPSLDGPAAEGEGEDGQGQDRPHRPPESFEKQGSLIALAWSKPPEEVNESPTEASLAPAAAAGREGGAKGRAVLPAEGTSDPATKAPGSSVDPTGSGAPVCPTQPAGHHCSTRGREEESPTPIHFIERNEVGLDEDRHRITLVAEAVSAACASPPTDSPVAQDHSHDLSAALTRDVYLGAAGGQESTVETCSVQMEDELEPYQVAQRERTSEPVSVLERERTMRSLVDMQRKVEKKQKRDRERQMLRVQERLSIIQNRKSEEDVLGLKRRDRLRHLTHNLPQEDKTLQKSAVRERLAQLKRERSNVMQSKRDRNTAGFRELLGPVAHQSQETGDAKD